MAEVYFHVDLDAFFASVEQVDHPEYRGKPVVVGAAPGSRGVVSACSYEARKFGIRSAMPIAFAFRRCPDAIYLPVRFERYREVSGGIMRLFEAYTPDAVRISIDEASLNLSGTERLLGAPSDVARRLKKEILDATGLTTSVGVAPNRYLAKLASEFEKPDGLYVVEPGGEEAFIDRLELADLWGLGKKTLARLSEVGITSVRALRAEPIEALKAKVGAASGAFLADVVRGIDPGVYVGERKSRSISNELTFAKDTVDLDRIRAVVLDLSHEVMSRLIDERVEAKTVTLKLRYADFTTVSAQETLRHPLVSAEEINSRALALFQARWSGAAVRLLGVGVSASDGGAQPSQPELFDGAFERKRKVEQAVHDIEASGTRVTKASLLGRKRRTNPWEVTE